ncbi:MAG: UDP-N-acetylglucosamine 1-carboxyvinyltransferase [Clostridiales bacterium]|nr:UDP-N-acetylglucosamine 1-carboxyvinyltransferase [Clostridiales bacterium]
MEKFIINGKRQLGGEISVHGSKNSVLPILASTLLIKGKSIIHNVPNLTDVDSSIKILEYLGAEVCRSGSSIYVDASDISDNTIPEEMMREMRSSIIFLGALLSRCKEAYICYPGGCEIGVRPIDLHLSSLRKLGAAINESGNCLSCKCTSLTGAKIILSFPSVGATENIIISAVLAKGKTTIINAAREPEISDLASFLNSCGARIFGAGEGTVEIEGVDALYSACHTVIPDRIVAATYMSAAAITSSELIIKNIRTLHLTPVMPVFSEMGCKMYISGNDLKISAPKRLKRVKNIKTMPYPGFPTDCQSIVMSALAKAKGTTVINESIFESRFKHVSELSRFGADITVNGDTAVISGVAELYGANVFCTDLRGGSALVLAALAAEGVSSIGDIYHIDRGYEKLENSLNQIGADITRQNVT